MSDVIVASQFDPKVNALLAQRAGLAVVDVPPGPLTALPPGAGSANTTSAPKGQSLLHLSLIHI